MCSAHDPKHTSEQLKHDKGFDKARTRMATSGMGSLIFVMIVTSERIDQNHSVFQFTQKCVQPN